MAPVPLEPEVRYLPLAVAAGHLVAATFLTLSVGRGLYRSYSQLSPAQGTRSRLTRRLTLTPLFAGLALFSLFLAGHATSTYATLSYKAWADERAVEVPSRIYGEKGILPYGDNSTQVYVARWLTDTPIYVDAFEIVAERARRFWWGQQIDLATISWSLLLSIEGRRRNIPFLWAYLALAHLVNLSFAQNLFYLALLLTPTPIPSDQGADRPATAYARIRGSIFPPKPQNWCPHPALFLAAFSLKFALLFWVPYRAGTESFAAIVLSVRGLTFAPLILPTIVPVSWGTVHPHPHTAYSSFTDLFRLLSFASFAFHGKATAVGLVYNTPDAHYHRHSRFLPFNREERSTWERTSTAFARVLGATSDHPVVTAIGRDVLLSGFSLGLWAAIRALDVGDILASSVPFYKGHTPALHPPPEVLEDKKPEPDSEIIKAEGSSSTRRRARQTKVKTEEADDIPAPKGTRRGRPRKVKVDPDQAPNDNYVPTPTESVAAVEGDVLPDGELDWESAALTWGLTAIGGLGFGSAGVFGGECISR